MASGKAQRNGAATDTRQQRMFPEADGPLAKACDAYLEAKTDLDKAQTVVNKTTVHLIKELRESKKASVKHAGRTFVLTLTEAKERITIKE